MGSFSEICAISKNYISCGDAVKVFFVAQNTKTDNKNTLLPVFFPISGTYNDYGYIENIVEDFNYNFFVNCIKKYFSHILPKTFRAPAGGLSTFIDLSYGGGCIGGAHLPAEFAHSRKDPQFEIRNSKFRVNNSETYNLKEGNQTFVTFVMVKEKVYDEILKSGMTLGFRDAHNNIDYLQFNTVVDNTPDFYLSFARNIREYYVYKQLSLIIENEERGTETKEEIIQRLHSIVMRQTNGRNGLKEYFIYDPTEKPTVFKHDNPLAQSLQSILFDEYLFITSHEQQYNTDCFTSIDRNMFVRELTHGLENDIEYAANILKSYCELFIYKKQLNQINTTFTGNCAHHSGEQVPGIRQALNSLFYTNSIATDLIDSMQTDTDANGIDITCFNMKENYSTDAYNVKVGKERLEGLRDSFLKHAEYLTGILNSENIEGEYNDQQ